MTTSMKANNVIPKQEGGDVWMKGGIHSDQRCPVCGSRFKDNHKNALECPKHPGQRATSFRVYFQKVTKRFSSYVAASNYLTGLRFKANEGTFDERDYRRSNPLGFKNQVMRYLNKKKGKVRCYRNIDNHLTRAIKWFGNTNIKDIGYGQIEDFLQGQRKENGGPLSGKTIHNIKATLHAFFEWVAKREKGVSMPDFPEVPYELGWRNTVSLAEQDEILDEVYRISHKMNRRIWLGIYLLSTYPKMRPVELIHVREKDIDLNLGCINITHNKERKPKIVALIEEDVELIKSFTRGLPDLYFFRHERGQLAGQRFGKHLLYSYWVRAARNCGYEGVDLYGGTKHSTVKGMRGSFLGRTR